MLSKAPRHPVPSPGRLGHLDVSYRLPNPSSNLVLLPSLSLAELENCCLTQAVTHTSSLTQFSDFHFSAVLCSPSTHTHYPSLCFQHPILRQAQQLSSGAKLQPAPPRRRNSGQVRRFSAPGPKHTISVVTLPMYIPLPWIFTAHLCATWLQ